MLSIESVLLAQLLEDDMEESLKLGKLFLLDDPLGPDLVLEKAVSLGKSTIIFLLAKVEDKFIKGN